MNTYTCNIQGPDVLKIKQDLQNQGFLMAELPYGHFKASHKQKRVTINVYLSLKCLIQGKGTEDFIRYYLEPQILKTFDLDYGHLDFEEKIGMDESGKGDYFGPLVVAAVYVTQKTYNEFKKAGVRDSKSVSDKQIEVFEKMIREKAPSNILMIGPEKYNALMAKFGNLNSLLGWAHATCLKNLIPRCDARKALLDQFGASWKMENLLKKMGISIPFEQMVRGESDIAVASASILARSVFLNDLKSLANQYEMKFPKGAGDPVLKAGQSFIAQHGEKQLAKVAKLHFKTTDKIKEG